MSKVRRGSFPRGSGPTSQDLLHSIDGVDAELAARAVARYTPIVGDRSLDVGDIERTLDGLLDFRVDPEILRLFRRLCRHCRRIDPAAMEAYVAAYHQLWAPDGGPPP